MRQLLLALASTFILLTGCDDREIENQLAATEAALASEKEKRLAAERRADEAEALNAEFQARGYPLTELLIRITIEASTLGDSAPPSVRRLATIAQLVRHDGSIWKLIDTEAQPPQIRVGENGAYRLDFTYQPEDPREVLGRDVADLAAIRGLRLHYGDILNNISLGAQYQVLSVSVVANGLPVVEAADLGSPAAPDGSGFETVDLASHFAEAPDKYATALKERARARRGQAAGSGTSAVEV